MNNRLGYWLSIFGALLFCVSAVAVAADSSPASGAAALFQIRAVADAHSPSSELCILRSGKTPEAVPVELTVLLDETALRSIKAKTGDDGAPAMVLTLTDDGRERWANLTAQNIGRRLAIFVMGKLISAPTLRQKISGRTIELSGGFTADEAALFAQKIHEEHPTTP